MIDLVSQSYAAFGKQYHVPTQAAPSVIPVAAAPPATQQA